MYSLADRVMEGVAWTGFVLYAVVRSWTGHARGKAPSELALQTPDKVNGSQPWWVAWCFAVVGLALDWRCAFEGFGGISPFYSEIVRRSGRVTPEEKDRRKSLCELLDREKDQMLRAQLLRELHELNERKKAEEKRWMAEQGWETS